MARLIGSVLGAGAVIALVAGGRPQIEPPRLGAMVSIGVASAGAIEVVVPGGGPALAASTLRPGDPPIRGQLVLANRATRPIRVHLDLATRSGGRPDRALSRYLALRAGANGEFAGGGPSRGAARRSVGAVIPAGATRRVPLTLALRADAGPDSLAGERISLILVPRREVL